MTTTPARKQIRYSRVDRVPFSKQTGKLVGGSNHVEKAQNTINRANNLLKSVGSKLNAKEIKALNSIKKDLEKALNDLKKKK